jgi:hypothetical protein
MQVSSNRLHNRHRESICVFTHSGPNADIHSVTIAHGNNASFFLIPYTNQSP